jgi:hypothetical protein
MNDISGVDKVVGRFLMDTDRDRIYKCVKVETANGYKFFFQNVDTIEPFNSPDNAEFRISLNIKEDTANITVRNLNYIGVDTLIVPISELSSLHHFILIAQKLIIQFNDKCK